ncbi:MAG: hypothetical protein CL808_02085 [Citromicrobium sp.]|nr:hypothetical protein [Citromicrobium sp.]
MPRSCQMRRMPMISPVNRRRIGMGAIIALAFSWGLAAGSYGIFPYPQLRALKNAIDGDDGSRDPSEYVGNPKAVEVGASDRQWNTRARTVIIGDSLAAHARLEEMFPGASVANRGVGGDTVQGAIERLPGILELQPERAIVFIGHNDILLDNPLDQILARFETLITRLQAAGVEPVLQAVLVCGENPACSPERRRSAIALNRQLALLARRKNIAFVDLNEELSGERGLKPGMTWDGIHLAARGNRVWRDAIAPYVLGYREPEKAIGREAESPR